MPLYLHDTIVNELVEIYTPEDAIKYVKENYTEGSEMHPDFSSFPILISTWEVYSEINEEDICTGIKIKPLIK